MKLAVVVGLAALATGAPWAAAAAPETWSASFEGGYQGLQNASNSAKAVFDGSTGGRVLGGSARLTVWRSFFVGAGVRVFDKSEGQRVFVDGPGGTVFRLGHPLELRLRPIYGFVGYALRSKAPVVPYLAVGAGSASYRESSTVAGVTTTDTLSKFTWHAALGADYALGAVALGFEARYTGIPDVVGLGGVSKVYGENDLGGITVVGRLSFRR